MATRHRRDEYEEDYDPYYERQQRKKEAQKRKKKKKKKQKARRHRRHRFFLAIHRLFTLFAVLIIAVAVGLRFFVTAPTVGETVPAVSPLSTGISADSAHYQREKNIYTFLLAGADNGNGNADTIIVAQFNGNTGGVNLVSVPRDTLIYREWSSFPKINAGMSKGMDTLKEEVSYTLGIPIDYTVQIGLDAFIAVVDALGGLEYDVPQDMYHDDEGGFIIDLQAGTQTLTGHQTLQLVRYRGYATADIGRTQTQQAVLKALAYQAISLENLVKIESFWGIFQEYVNTNLETNDFLWFAKILLANGTDFQMETMTLEGNGRGIYNGYSWCYELDQAKTLEMVNLYLNPYTEARTLDDMTLLRASSYS